MLDSGRQTRTADGAVDGGRKSPFRTVGEGFWNVCGACGGTRPVKGLGMPGLMFLNSPLFMYLCMYVCMHVCAYVCTYVCMYLYKIRPRGGFFRELRQYTMRYHRTTSKTRRLDQISDTNTI